MASDESRMYADSIADKVERILACLDGRSPEEIARRPPVPGGNSLLILAIHTIGSLEESMLEGVGGQSVNRDRDSEFRDQPRSVEEVRERWNDVHSRIRPVIKGLSEQQLAQEYQHPRRGGMSGREMLLHAATHAAEHVGHAELTRDWLDS